MGYLNKYKIFALFVLIIHIALCYFLFLNTHSKLIQNNNFQDNNKIYILIALILISGVSLFILVIQLTKIKEIKGFSQETNNSEDENLNNETKVQEKKEEKFEDIDIEHYLKKILPKDNSKLTAIKFTEKILSNFAKEFDIVQGLFFIRKKGSSEFIISGKYAYFGENNPPDFKIGETLSGQAAFNKTILYVNEIPENYVTILSGLGSSSPRFLLIIPVVFNNETVAVIELASFKEIKEGWNKVFEEIAVKIGESITKYLE